MLVALPLLLAAKVRDGPPDPMRDADTWEWCDFGTGKHQLQVWPELGDPLACKNVTAGTAWLHWEYPVSTVLWRCDGMEKAQRTTLKRPRTWWNVTYTVEKKLDIIDSGRLHFASWNVNVTSAPRTLTVRGQSFVDGSGQVVLLEGTNIVMKGAPWIPPVTGNSICADRWFSNFTCYSFSHADATHITQTMGWNFIRLGVVWAGGQPTAAPSLDAAWLARLDTFLKLCHEYHIYVVLDVHQDAVGTATCGEGVPQWVSELATPSRIGKPLTPLPGAAHLFKPGPDGLCDQRNDTASWALHAGSPDYNLLNPCCLLYNGGGSSWVRNELTWEGQETMNYLFRNRDGRARYVQYVAMLAAAVKEHPNAIGIELMNEPPSIDRSAMYSLWQECYEAIRQEVPDMAVGVMDTGYGPPIKDPKQAIKNVQRVMARWNVAALMTEMEDCSVKVPAVAAGIGWSFWEYSGFCDRPVHAGEHAKVCPSGGCTFGACITGTNGNSWKNLTCA